MKKTFIYSSILALGLLVVGCSPATSYHAKDYSGKGFSEYRLANDRFNVCFRANEYTDMEDVRMYALRRASEVTTNHGYRYFTVVNERDLSHKEVIKNKTSHKEESTKEPSVWDLASETIELMNGKKKTTTGTTTHLYESKFPAIELTIRCFNDDPREESIDAYRFLSYQSA